MLIAAIDFDGTLVNEDATGSFHLVEGAKEAMESLRSSGYRIIIHTCRTGIAAEENRIEAELDIIRRVLTHFEIPYDEIYTGMKLVADIYIDDRAIGFTGNWDQAAASAAKIAGELAG